MLFLIIYVDMFSHTYNFYHFSQKSTMNIIFFEIKFKNDATLVFTYSRRPLRSFFF